MKSKNETINICNNESFKELIEHEKLFQDELIALQNILQDNNIQNDKSLKTFQTLTKTLYSNSTAILSNILNVLEKSSEIEGKVELTKIRKSAKKERDLFINTLSSILEQYSLALKEYIDSQNGIGGSNSIFGDWRSKGIKSTEIYCKNTYKYDLVSMLVRPMVASMGYSQIIAGMLQDETNLDSEQRQELITLKQKFMLNFTLMDQAISNKEYYFGKYTKEYINKYLESDERYHFGDLSKGTYNFVINLFTTNNKESVKNNLIETQDESKGDILNSNLFEKNKNNSNDNKDIDDNQVKPNFCN